MSGQGSSSRLLPRRARLALFGTVAALHAGAFATFGQDTGELVPSPNRAIAVALVMPGRPSQTAQPSTSVRHPVEPSVPSEHSPTVHALPRVVSSAAQPSVSDAPYAVPDSAEHPSSPTEPSQAPSPSGRLAPPQQPTNGGAGGGKTDYGTLVAIELNRLKTYPPAARAARNTGSARFSYSVSHHGRIERFALIGSSGFSVLDDAAARLFAAVRLPPPPGGSFHSTVTINYSLRTP